MDDINSIASEFKSGLDSKGKNFNPLQDSMGDVTLEEDAPVPVEHINNPDPLGISVRVKDVLLIGGTTALTGFLAFRTKSPLQLLAVVAPLHAVMLYGITTSYFATQKLAIAFAATGTAVSTGVTVGLSALLTPDTDNHK